MEEVLADAQSIVAVAVKLRSQPDDQRRAAAGVQRSWVCGLAAQGQSRRTGSRVRARQPELVNERRVAAGHSVIGPADVGTTSSAVACSCPCVFCQVPWLNSP